MEKLLPFHHNQKNSRPKGSKVKRNSKNNKSTYISYNLESVFIHTNLLTQKSGDAIIEDGLVKYEATISNNKNIIDIKQMTTNEVLKLINEKLKVYDDSDIDLFRIDSEANKLLTKKSVFIKSLDIE